MRRRRLQYELDPATKYNENIQQIQADDMIMEMKSRIQKQSKVSNKISASYGRLTKFTPVDQCIRFS
jgi:hypothetical protein